MFLLLNRSSEELGFRHDNYWCTRVELSTAVVFNALKHSRSLQVQFRLFSTGYIYGFTVAERSNAWTIFARSDSGIVGSNPTQRMDVWCVCVVLCLGRGPGTSWSLVQGVLPSVIRSWNWKKRSGTKGAVEVKKNIYGFRMIFRINRTLTDWSLVWRCNELPL
jgi:hypothetical protein